MNEPAERKRSENTVLFSLFALFTKEINTYITTTAAAMSSPICAIDRTILNNHTIGKVDNLGLAVFAKLCGVNRGAFVLDPPDGKTYR